jgi:hypothetical protein
MMFLVSCKQQEHIESLIVRRSNVVITRQEPKSVSYHLNTVVVVHMATNINNRTDSTNLKNGFDFDSGDMNGDEFHLPFPLTVSYLKDIKKSFFLAQIFAAYEKDN